MITLRGEWRAELRGVLVAYAAVVFQNGPRVGASLIGLSFLQPTAGLTGLLATVAAHATSLLVGWRSEERRTGAHGFNAALLGLLLGSLAPLSVPLLVLAVLGGAACAGFTVVFGHAMRRVQLPGLVVPFLGMAWLLTPLLEQHPHAGPLLANHAWQLPGPLADLLAGFASVYCQADPLAGLLVLGILFAASRHGGMAALLGAGVALGTAGLFGARQESNTASLAALNGAFTGLALGAYLLAPGRWALLLSVATAALCGVLTVSLGELLQAVRLPLLSSPFALVTLLTLRGLQHRTVIRAPYFPPLPLQSPEANAEFVENMARRFGPPGVPEFCLPLAEPAQGSWTVSQGNGGEATHRGAWEHAWDFEMVDDEGFPFRGHGNRKEDYFCHNHPVCAPALGTVVLASDGIADSEPGTVNTSQPWGNAVVLCHAPNLYTVLAHLRPGSLRVQVGQVVACGEVLAACGSSGRSPRPHLHFQAQASAMLGAPAVPARFVHYQLGTAGCAQFVAFGIPNEGERLAPVPPAPTLGLLAALAPGQYLQFDLESATSPLRLLSEISPLGERWLRDLDRGDCLFFVANTHEVVFTCHRGPATAPLRLLLLALPRMAWLPTDEWRFSDSPPAAATLGGVRYWLYSLAQPFLDLFRLRTELHAQRHADLVRVVTHSVAKGSAWHCAGTAELDAFGLASFSLLRSDSPNLFFARRSPVAAALPVLPNLLEPVAPA